jgi:outer membrane biogenesis lipoprotein LolB
MNCMMAKRHRILLSVLALFLIGACSRNEEIEQQTSPSGGIEVAILCDNTKEPQVYSLPDGTRTWIDDNDWASTRWDKNDKIALWATADGSNYTLSAPIIGA